MTVIRLDKVTGNHLESIQAPKQLVNGEFLQLGALVEGETELRTATVPTDVANGVIVFHATPEVDPDPRKAGLKHFTVEAGEEGRAYHLTLGDIVTLTEDRFEVAPIVGDFVQPNVGTTKLGEIVVDAEARLQFEVIEETSLGFDGTTAFAVQVVKAV